MILRSLRPELSARTILAALIVATAVTAANARAATDTDVTAASPTSTKLETDTFLAEITTTGPYKSGEAGGVRVSLTTKGAFHINGQYPYRFKTAVPAEGVSYPKPVLERTDGQFEEKKAVFNVPFVASHAGKFDIGGVFHMSVCSAGSCVVQKAPLEVSVNVQ
jgi:hypothetical protein